MSEKALLERFDLVVDYPENIPLLRRYIVDLAVRGKLLPTTEQDISATEILSRIAAKTELLIKQGQLKKSKPLPAIGADELPLAYVAHCQFERLGNVANLQKGLTGIQGAVPGEFPLVVTAAARSTCDHYDFDGAAVIVPMVSSTGHGHASLNRLHYQEGKFALGTILCAVFPIDEELLSARFLFEYLTAFKDDLLVSKMNGTANVTLTVNKIAEVPVPLIAPAVQRRIEELMVLCDQLVDAQNERTEKRDLLVTSSLNQVGLMPHDLEEQPSEFFYAGVDFYLTQFHRLTTSKAHIKQFRQAVLNLAIQGSFSISENLSVDKKETPLRELSTLVKIVRGSSPRPKGDPKYYGGVIPRLLIADITRDGKFVTPKIDSLTEEGAQLSRPMKIGSLVIAISGSYGIPAFLAVDACIHDGFIGFRELSTEILPEYLYLVLLWRKPYFDSVVKDSGLKNLTTDHLKQLLVPLPSVLEQKVIIAKIDELMSLCDRLEAQLSTTESESRSLLEAVLRNAMASDEVAAE